MASLAEELGSDSPAFNVDIEPPLNVVWISDNVNDISDGDGDVVIEGSAFHDYLCSIPGGHDLIPNNQHQHHTSSSSPPAAVAVRGFNTLWCGLRSLVTHTYNLLQCKYKLWIIRVQQHVILRSLDVLHKSHSLDNRERNRLVDVMKGLPHVSPLYDWYMYVLATCSCCTFISMITMSWYHHRYMFTSKKLMVTLGSYCFCTFIITYHQWMLERHGYSIVRLVLATDNVLSNMRRAVQIVQEMELVRRGYRITHPLPPVTRLESDACTTYGGLPMMCMRLRRAIDVSTRRFGLCIKNNTQLIVTELPSEVGVDDVHSDMVCFREIPCSLSWKDDDSVCGNGNISLANLRLAVTLCKRIVAELVWRLAMVHIHAGENENSNLFPLIGIYYKINEVIEVAEKESLVLMRCMNIIDMGNDDTSGHSKDVVSMPWRDITTELQALNSLMHASMARLRLCHEWLDSAKSASNAESITDETAVRFSATSLQKILLEMKKEFVLCDQRCDEASMAVDDCVRRVFPWSKESSITGDTPSVSDHEDGTVVIDNTLETVDHSSERIGTRNINIYEGGEMVFETIGADEEYDGVSSVKHTLSREERIVMAQQEREAEAQRCAIAEQPLFVISELKDVILSRKGHSSVERSGVISMKSSPPLPQALEPSPLPSSNTHSSGISSELTNANSDDCVDDVFLSELTRALSRTIES